MQQITLHWNIFFIQEAVNPLGVAYVAPFNTVGRIDDFVMTIQ